MTDEVKQTWDLDATFNQHVSQEAMKEATAFRTLPTGSYVLTPEKVERIVGSEKSPWPGRKMIHLQVSAEAKLPDETGKRMKGKLFFDVSPEEIRVDGKIDGPTKLFAQYAKAFGPEKSIGEVIESLALYPVDGYVTEVAMFKGAGEGGKNKYVTVKNDSGRAQAISDAMKNGGELKNFVQNVSAVK